MYSLIRTTILAALLTTLAQTQGRPVTPAGQTAGQSWWAHIQALADDSMQGRLTGSEGYRTPLATSSRNSTPPASSPPASTATTSPSSSTSPESSPASHP